MILLDSDHLSVLLSSFSSSEFVNELNFRVFGIESPKNDRTGLRRIDDRDLGRDKPSPGILEIRFIHTLGVWEQGEGDALPHANKSLARGFGPHE